jgi:hypothetical protein
MQVFPQPMRIKPYIYTIDKITGIKYSTYTVS